MPMLQPHMTNVKIKTYDVETYAARWYDIKNTDVLKTAAIRRVSAHTVKITIRYARIDSVRCLNGQYMA